jgi:hypothetical protein
MCPIRRKGQCKKKRERVQSGYKRNRKRGGDQREIEIDEELNKTNPGEGVKATWRDQNFVEVSKLTKKQ